MEIIYEIKNYYSVLKEFILVSRCEEYQEFVRQYGHNELSQTKSIFKIQQKASNFKRAFLLTSIEK